jgi:hypothetical protein
MVNKRFLLVFVLFLMLTLLQACALFGGAPDGFIRSVSGGDWSTILLREDVDFDRAFNEVLDVCAKRFEMDMISKEGAYARTKWIYTWNTLGNYNERYRTRVIFKFSADKTRVDIKTEAEWGGDPYWEKGYDTRLLESIKQDISGAVGRTVL